MGGCLGEALGRWVGLEIKFKLVSLGSSQYREPVRFGVGQHEEGNHEEQRGWLSFPRE